MARKQRTDAERRLRQSERLSRLLRTLRLLSGPGRWNVESLAREMECSRRTVYRDLTTLSLSGIPWYLDAATQAYKIRPGFRFPGLDQLCDSLTSERISDLEQLQVAADELLNNSERFVVSLKEFSEVLQRIRGV